jgi:hypothetical protein
VLVIWQYWSELDLCWLELNDVVDALALDI